MKTLNWIVETLLIVGGLNWGFTGIYLIDPLAILCDGIHSPLYRAVLILIGLAALYKTFSFRQQPMLILAPSNTPD